MRSGTQQTGRTEQPGSLTTEPVRPVGTIPPAPAATEGAAPRRAAIARWRQAGLGMMLMLVLVGIKVALEHTAFMHQVSLTTYDGIQGLLQAEHCPVVVVDISNVPATSWAEGRSLTDRARLGEIVAMIAAQRPAAIGIDLDFSPNYDPLAAAGSDPIYHAPDRQDPDFFDACLAQRRSGVPVFLGVYGASPRPASQRLVRPEYAELAADIRVDIEDNRLVPASFGWQGDGDPVPALASALAEAYRRDRSEIPSWLRWAMRNEVVTPLEGGGQAREVYVDFSALETLVTERVNFLDVAGTINQDEFARIQTGLTGKIVLLGAADSANPKEGCFAVPGRRQAYPGVYLHAAAAYTQVRAPLRALTPAGRVAVDVLLASSVLAAVGLLRQQLVRRGRQLSPSWTQRLPLLITVGAMVATFGIGVLAVNLTHVIWDDFVVVFLALGLHLPLERHLETWRHAHRTRAVRM